MVKVLEPRTRTDRVRFTVDPAAGWKFWTTGQHTPNDDTGIIITIKLMSPSTFVGLGERRADSVNNWSSFLITAICFSYSGIYIRRFWLNFYSWSGVTKLSLYGLQRFTIRDGLFLYRTIELTHRF